MIFENTKKYCLISLLFILNSLFVLAESSPLLRISVENEEDHIQSKYVRIFAELLQERTNGSTKVEFYHSGTLYRGQEVINALYTGKIEMAVPGTWHVSSYIPEISYFLLPEFFGEEKEYNYEYINSDEGSGIIKKIEKELKVVVPGDWLDLGHAAIFTTDRNKITAFSDLKGKTIRVAGGIMNKRRIELLGADGVIISWSDIPYHLNKGTIDGLLTTFETIKSAELWKYGVKYAFIDNEYFPQYIPMVAERYWNRISEYVQKIFISTWNEVVREQRIEAENAQVEARKTAEENGVIITYPREDDLRKAKAMLLSHQKELISEIIHE